MTLKFMAKKNKSGLFEVFTYGLFVWLIPFLIAFFLYTPQGTPYISEGFFKSAMFIAGTITATAFLLMYFDGISRNFFKEGIKVGVVWVIMSIVLDLILLVTWAKMNLAEYFMDIALGYGAIIVICVFAGKLLEEKSGQNKKLPAQINSAKK